MLVADVNVLVNAMNQASDHHRQGAHWIQRVDVGDQRVGIAEMVASGTVRVTTGTKMEQNRRTTAEAFAFCDAVYAMPAAVRITEGPRHWSIFPGVVFSSGVSGKDSTDVLSRGVRDRE